MGWLSAAIWEVCLSMLPQRNTRALLVPILCIALLASLTVAADTEATSIAAKLSTTVRVQQTHGIGDVHSHERNRQMIFLERDGNAIVPRKFTIPEPSVVAEAEHKHVAMLPSRPYEAVAYEQRLLKRSMLEQAGVSLVDTMVVVTVDGRLYGVNRDDGSIVWERECLFEAPGLGCPRSLVRTQGQQAEPLVENNDIANADPELDNKKEEEEEEEEWLLEQGIDWRSDPQVHERQRQQRRAWLGQRHGNSTTEAGDGADLMYIAEPGGGGALYVYSTDMGLKRLPLTIANLVDQSPVQVHGVLYSGAKEATFAAIDAATGKLLDVYGDARTDQAQMTQPQVRLLLSEKLDRVRIFADGATGRSGALQWELHHRSIDAPALDGDSDALLTELSDAVEALGMVGAANGPTKFVMTHDGGFVMVEAATGMPLWAQEFAAPVANVFDVFGLAEQGSNSVQYVARRRNLGPAAQQQRHQRWRQLHEMDDDVRAHERGGWRAGSAGGNVLAGAFWERTGGTQPQAAYVGRLRDTLYTLTSDEFPLIDHATLTSSLLLALAQARRHQERYPALQTREWWERWSFLTHDAVVLRVLQEARAWWLASAASSGTTVDNPVARLLDAVQAANAAQICPAGDRCLHGSIVGIHPLEINAPALEGETLGRLALPGGDADTEEEHERDFSDSELVQDPAGSEEWPWWRYVGHYMTRVAAFIGYMVTITVLVAFVGAIYLLRPRNKRRPRMWIDAADDAAAPGRRARLQISWALMHRMWDTLKDEWRAAIDEAWRNPNAAAVLRRTGVARSPSSSSATSPGVSREPSRSSSAASFGTPRRGSASLGLLSREISEPSSLERAASGVSTLRRNSTGNLPMTPLKRASLDDSDRLQSTGRSQLGAIVLSDQVLGYGSHGTVVYRGEFQGRAVAVKRLLLDFYDVADHEVQVLQESDSHPNVIRYFCTERHDHFMYIALELCCGSLADAVLRSPDKHIASRMMSTLPKKNVLYQLACGLHHLHALKLVHRDIKPQNILIAPPPHRRRRRHRSQRNHLAADAADLAFEDFDVVAGAGAPRVLISDFGLSRILDDDESSFANTFTMHAHAAPAGLPPGMVGGVGGGTVGWRAPECFDSPEARMALANAADTSNNSSWPSIPHANLEDPSPYVSRGTRSRMRSLAISSQSGPDNDAEDPDSLGLSTDRAGSSLPLLAGTASRRRMTRAVDIFSLGCVFYYVLMDGDHPFGDRLSREQRILSGAPDLRALEASSNPSAIDAVDLIAHMVARSARDRPSAASVLVHPYFWDASQRLAFLQDVSDCLEAEARLIKAAREDVPQVPKKPKPSKKKTAEKPAAHAIPNESIEDIIGRLPAEQAAAVRRAITLLDAFEENSAFVMESAPPSVDGFQVVGMPPAHTAALEAMDEAVGHPRQRRIVWDRRLDPHLRRDLGKFRKYDGTRLRDLLRIIRNKKNHYQDMPPPLREALGDIPDGYLHYFESRFPYLLLHCYYFVLEDDSLRTATIFRPYFRAPSQ
ncbi:bifunctional endoribonuclease/protein kinase ire1 [Coemansia sp. RSA 1250]|nr:bifunctional endoribonuclease/protein kinase ire1 [Coemansia sp. RSA 1250]